MIFLYYNSGCLYFLFIFFFYICLFFGVLRVFRTYFMFFLFLSKIKGLEVDANIPPHDA